VRLRLDLERAPDRTLIGMDTRALGTQGLTVSAQGLGCMGMSQSYGEADEATSLATLHRALELGVRFWDTANVYGDAGPGGFGANERLLAQVLAEHRDEVTVATKMGIEGIAPQGPVRFRIDGSPDNVRRRCEESLERLGTDHIDLYYLHRVDPDTPIEDTIGAMGDLVQAGKVRYVGVSEVTAEQLERAHAAHPISAVQSEWSLWTRDIEPEVLPTARRLGVGLVPFSPLGRGFLTGALSGRTFSGSDSRARMPRFTDENLAANEAIVAEVAAVAEAHGVLPGQVALAWVGQQGEDVVPIPGTKRVEYLEQNVAALDVHLTEDELARLDALAARVAGGRY
jgi:aryl-alcohol dehydrogenase-like predicted oxidoreductase